MRGLRRAEAVVAQRILAGTEGTDSDGLARRTRETVRSRLRSWGWFTDRYVPAPALLGTPFLTFALAHPFLERSRALVDRVRRQDGGVVVWSFPNTVLVVFATSGEPIASRFGSALVPPDEGRLDLLLTVDTRESAVPAYFDFEGAWTRVAELPAPAAYPVGLPMPSPFPGDGSTSPLSEGEREAMVRLVSLPTGTDDGGTSARRPRTTALGPLERRCVERSWARPRAFLNPAAVGRTVSGFPSQLAFLHGRWSRSPPDGPALLRALASESGLFPFLLAHDREKVLIGAGALGGASPSLRRPPGSSEPVLATLARFLDHIELRREPVLELRSVVDHRYDRLVGPGTTE